MRTSLNKIEETERFLNAQLCPDDHLMFQVRLVLDHELNEQVQWQQKTYKVICAYGRMQLRERLEEIHQQLMTDPKHESFKNKILNFFSL